MSELNRVIETRLAAVETGVTEASDAAINAHGAAIAAQGSADEANAKFFIGNSPPGSPFQGSLWADTSTNTLKFFDGEFWLAQAREE